jgi:hypothetical protein
VLRGKKREAEATDRGEGVVQAELKREFENP